ncbi:biopolymer transporter ExbD [Pseudoalteromonas sp. SWXJZ94C]|uniref:biopolymer transporter ExbD n=1 Tax=unclassified Pseudoalteromonas TaxID=194690 RepID=UPI00140AB2F0|nr:MULTISPECIES: biopolymer transporter ExbD [unclassified Pseudoalteromonas]MBH0058819.1 biopolymer transporter ExbD [Pseudoalteromonas sp. SWXJZ94C]
MLELPTTNSKTVLLPDLTALLDVLFILLVFLLLTAAVKLNMLDVTLPDTGKNTSTPVQQADVQVLSVRIHNGKAQYGLEQQLYDSLSSAIAGLKVVKQDIPLYLAVDEQVPSGDLVALLAALSAEKYQIANILVKSE